MHTFTLDRQFSISDLQTWYERARVGETARIAIPAMRWSLEVTKAGRPDTVLLHPEGHRARTTSLTDLLTTLAHIHQGLTLRTAPAP